MRSLFIRPTTIFVSRLICLKWSNVTHSLIVPSMLCTGSVNGENDVSKQARVRFWILDFKVLLRNTFVWNWSLCLFWELKNRLKNTKCQKTDQSHNAFLSTVNITDENKICSSVVVNCKRLVWVLKYLLTVKV